MRVAPSPGRPDLVLTLRKDEEEEQVVAVMADLDFALATLLAVAPVERVGTRGLAPIGLPCGAVFHRPGRLSAGEVLERHGYLAFRELRLPLRLPHSAGLPSRRLAAEMRRRMAGFAPRVLGWSEAVRGEDGSWRMSVEISVCGWFTPRQVATLCAGHAQRAGFALDADFIPLVAWSARTGSIHSLAQGRQGSS